MRYLSLSGLIIILSVIFSFQRERPALAIDIDQGNPPTDIINQEITNGIDLFPDGIDSPNFDPDLEPGFPVQTWHTSGSYMSGPVISTRVGNIDADPELEILVTGLCQGPLYAFNHDGTQAFGWPVIYYNRAFYTSLGNISNQNAGLEIFTGQFVYRVPETPPGPEMAYFGDGSMMAGWPVDSDYDIYAPASLADINGDTLDEIFIHEGTFKLHAYSVDGTPLPGWPVDGEGSRQAIADLDGNGDLEIVTYIDWYSTGAYLVAYHHNGIRMDNFYVHFDPLHRPFPVIGDVDDDGSNEVIFLSGLHGDPYFGIFIVGPTGLIERIIPFCTNVECLGAVSDAPALADMDEDHVPEIIVGAEAGIWAFQGDGTMLPGFPVKWGSPYDYWIGNNAPVVGDVDGDQSPDIVMTTTESGQSEHGQVYVYNSQGQLNPHFPKDLDFGSGAAPAIADIDLDGRNEIIITGSFWNGHSGYYDNVWVYDLGGTSHGNVEWGQLGGGPQNWGFYPAPPTNPGINLYVRSSEFIGSDPGQSVGIIDRYGNSGVTIASSVTMTATLETGLLYVSDTSGITPTIDGQIIVWNLSDTGFSVERQFEIIVQVPPDSMYGQRFTISLSISAEQFEADPSDNLTIVNIDVARLVFLPLTHR